MCCTVLSLLATTHYEDLYSYREVTVPAESYFTVVPGSSRSKIIHSCYFLFHPTLLLTPLAVGIFPEYNDTCVRVQATYACKEVSGVDFPRANQS